MVRANERTSGLVGVTEAAAELGVSAATLRRACDAGAVACRRSPGGHRRFSRDDLQGLSRDRVLRAGRDGNPAEREVLRALADLGEAVSRWRDVDELLRSVAGLMLSATGAVTCDIFKLEEEGVHRCLVSLDRTGPDQAATGSVLRTEMYPNAGRAIVTQAAVVVEDRSHASLTSEDIAVYDQYGFESEVLVPLIVEDRVVGLVNLFSDRPNGFASSLEYLRGAGHVVAGALKKALLLAALEDRDRIMVELLEIASLLSQTHDAEELLRSVAMRLLAAVHASHCDIYRRDAAGYVCVVSAGRDGFLDWYEGARLGPAASPSSMKALAENRPLIVVDVAGSDLTEEEKQVLLRQDIASEFGIPLVASDQSVGFIDLFDARPRDWRECTGFAVAAGQLIAGTLQNAALFGDLQRSNRETELLNEIARRTTASLDLGEIVEAAVASLARLSPISTYSLALLEDGEFREVYGSRSGRRQARGEDAAVVDDRLLDRLRAERVIVADTPAAGSGLSAHHGVAGNAAGVGIALFEQHILIGVLMIGSETPGAFSTLRRGVFERIGIHLSLAANNARLYQEIKTLHLSNLMGLSTALNAKDYYTLGHAARVAAYIVLLGDELGWDSEWTERVREAAYLHDIGKIGVSDRVLLKQGKLNAEEWELMRQHPVVSAEIIKPLFSPELVAAVRHHHERYDGGGYPSGLAGDEIPELARALCVVDSYDAMSLQRPYRNALDADACIEELRSCRGAQFDPRMTDAFLRVLERLGALRERAQAAAAAAAARIDPLRHARLRTPADEARPEYAEVVEVLRQVRDAYPEVRYLTTGALLEDRSVIVVDAEEPDSDERSPLGEEIMADDALLQVLAGQPIDSNVLFVDNFGVWVNGVVPLCDENGRILAAVVADVPALPSGGAEGFARMTTETPVSTLQEAAVRLSRAEIEAITDGLTGLYNHRYLHERLTEELGRARVEHIGLSLLFCDLDFFKTYNDRLGHAAGDAALRATARIIEGCTRRADLAARYGGEEFVVVLPGTGEQEAREIAGRIRTTVSAFHRERGDLTISIGVASFPASAETKEELLEAADRALYLAKRLGRDRVEVASRDR